MGGRPKRLIMPDKWVDLRPQALEANQELFGHSVVPPGAVTTYCVDVVLSSFICQ